MLCALTFFIALRPLPCYTDSKLEPLQEESFMKIGMQFAMPAELHALPGAKELEPFEIISGIPFYQLAPEIIA